MTARIMPLNSALLSFSFTCCFGSANKKKMKIILLVHERSFSFAIIACTRLPRSVERIG